LKIEKWNPCVAMRCAWFYPQVNQHADCMLANIREANKVFTTAGSKAILQDLKGGLKK